MKTIKRIMMIALIMVMSLTINAQEVRKQVNIFGSYYAGLYLENINGYYFFNHTDAKYQHIESWKYLQMDSVEFIQFVDNIEKIFEYEGKEEVYINGSFQSGDLYTIHIDNGFGRTYLLTTIPRGSTSGFTYIRKGTYKKLLKERDKVKLFLK